MAGKQVQHEVLSNPLISPFKIPKTCTAEQLNVIREPCASTRRLKTHSLVPSSKERYTLYSLNHLSKPILRRLNPMPISLTRKSANNTIRD